MMKAQSLTRTVVFWYQLRASGLSNGRIISERKVIIEFEPPRNQAIKVENMVIGRGMCSPDNSKCRTLSELPNRF